MFSQQRERVSRKAAGRVTWGSRDQWGDNKSDEEAKQKGKWTHPRGKTEREMDPPKGHHRRPACLWAWSASFFTLPTTHWRLPRAPKNWRFWTVVLEKTLESPLDCKNIKPVHPKGNQSWIFIGRTDAEAEALILWPPDVNWFVWKDPDAGEDWRQEEMGTTEDEMVGWHHQLDGHESEQAPEVGDGQGSLVCCSPWGHKESCTTEWLNWTEI